MATSGRAISLFGIAAGAALCGLLLLGMTKRDRSTPLVPTRSVSDPRDAAQGGAPDRVQYYPDPRGKSAGSRFFVDRRVIDGAIFDIVLNATGKVEHPDRMDSWHEALTSRVANALARQKSEAIREGIDASLTLLPSSASLALLKDRSYLQMYEGDFVGATATLKRALEAASRPDTALEDRAEILAFLGIAALRRGELENCVACVGPSSCIFPIEPDAFHTNPSGSREAVQYFLEYLKLRPGDLRVQWMLNLAYMTLGEYPSKVPPEYFIPNDRVVAAQSLPRFPNVAAHAGLQSRGPAEAGGSIFDDFNGDGYPDLFLTTIDIDRGCILWINQGDGTFKDDSTRAGIGSIPYALNLRGVDYDNDGDMDVLLLRGAWEVPMPLTLLRNDGTGVFTDVTSEAGLEGAIASESAAWADYDNDGFLDVFICGEYKPNNPDPRNLCRLYHNDGKGHFTDVAREAGVQNARYAKGCAWADVDNDGKLDLFVSNMSSGDWMASRLYKNQGDGKFVDMATSMGLGSPMLYFTCTFWDYDNDGWQDLFVSNFNDSIADVAAWYLGVQTETVGHPGVFRNMRGTGFQDVSAELGFDRPIPAMSLTAGDLDNDGWLDLHMGTGWMSFSGLSPNLTYHSVGGKRFEDVSEVTHTGHLQKGHGIAMADYDRDGDLDLLSTFGGGYPGDQAYNGLFQNPGNANHWLSVKLVGRRSNRLGIGSRINVYVTDADGTKRIIRRVVGDNGSFAGNPFEQHIGIGSATKVDRIVVEWPTTGQTQTIDALDADQRIEIVEDEGFHPLSLKK